MVDGGYCRYCHQVIMFEDDEAIHENDIEEVATMRCNCGSAQMYQDKVARIERANDNIGLALSKEHPEVAEFMKQATGKGTKVTVNKTAKGTIKVKKNVSRDVIYDE